MSSGGGTGTPIGGANLINPSGDIPSAWPLLSLERWRAVIGYNPWHFWGLWHSTIAPVSSACNAVVQKYAWQAADAGGRDDIAEAIITAEHRFQGLTGFWPAPRYCKATVKFPQYPNPQVSRLGYGGSDGRWISLVMPDKHIQAIGVESLTSLSSNAALVFSDADGDGVNDTFTITLAVPTTDAGRIAVYFKAADRLGEVRSEKWRVPVRVSISAGTATIVGRAWNVVKPLLYETAQTDLHADDAANFVTGLEVYDRGTEIDGTTETTAQVTFIWETLPYPYWCSLPANSTDPASYAYAIGRATIRDARAGIIGVGEALYDPIGAQWYSTSGWNGNGAYRPPDRVEVRYLAGWPLQDNIMSPKMERIIARFAAAEMSRRICACDNANREIYRWQFDLSRSGGSNDEAYAYFPREKLNNPFGMLRGQVYAYDESIDIAQFDGLAF